MHRLAPFLFIAASTSAAPAFAHLSAAGTAHWHASDVAGLMCVAALTGAAIWIDRRMQRARRRRTEQRPIGRRS